ncbi:MAG TPA: DUF3224 domain-containing protein [Thermomicrobiales bacterium]|jgi:hypothetical protein|nr:DUF3224 domain-containing protein [Thermomicrobiales bacterium]
MAINRATITFGAETWQESTYVEGPGEIQLIQADATQMYSGDMIGKGTARYLMTYAGQNAVLFSGQEQVTGTLDGRDGSFVVRWVGENDGPVLTADGVIQPGSGTGELAGISGTARLEADRTAGPTTMTLDWEISG